MQETSDIAVDRWIHGELARAYDVILREEIPDQLLRMLEAFEAPHTSGF